MQNSISAIPYPTCDVERDQSKRQVIPAAYVKALREVIQDGMPRRSADFMRDFDTVLSRQQAQRAALSQIDEFELETSSPRFVQMMNKLFGHRN